MGRLAKEAKVQVAYDREGLRMEVDDECVNLYMENIKRIEMTRDEFENLMEAYDDLAIPQKKD